MKQSGWPLAAPPFHTFESQPMKPITNDRKLFIINSILEKIKMKSMSAHDLHAIITSLQPGYEEPLSREQFDMFMSALVTAGKLQKAGERYSQR